jgi:hypothetical protein
MASFESTERHLTPTGWVTGTQIWDGGGRSEVAPPPDRVLTVVWTESCGGFSVPIGNQRELWRCVDGELIARLLVEFGPAERDL